MYFRKNINSTLKTSIIFIIFLALVLSVTVSQNTFAKSAKDSKARRDID